MTKSIALVTGGASGIGRAVSLRLVKDGWHVVAVGRTLASLHALSATVGRKGSLAVHPVDVAETNAVESLFAHIADEYGRLDLLVNNAGILGPRVAVDSLAYEDWRNVTAVNLDGAFLCAQAAFRIMKRQNPCGGRIINNGSLSAQVPRPYATAYTVAKHGITGLTKSLSLEGREFSIACGQIDIGNAATALSEGVAASAIQANGTTIDEPTFDVEHVANAVSYMASLPLDANVQFLTIMATAMPFIGRG